MAWEKGAGGAQHRLVRPPPAGSPGHGLAPGRASICTRQVLDKRPLAGMTHSTAQDRAGPSLWGQGTTPPQRRGLDLAWDQESWAGPDSGEGGCPRGQPPETSGDRRGLLREGRNQQVWTWAGLLHPTQNQVHCACSPGTQLSPQRLTTLRGQPQGNGGSIAQRVTEERCCDAGGRGGRVAEDSHRQVRRSLAGTRAGCGRNVR